jgi:hypothetical protein
MKILVPLLLLLFVTSTDANAQATNCMPAEQVSAWLAETYNEHPVAEGLVNDAAAMLTYLSIKGTWTIVVRTPQGFSCVVLAGHSWNLTGSVIPEKPGF